MYNFGITILVIVLLLFFSYDNYNNKKQNQIQQLQQLQDAQRKQLYEFLGEAVVATEHQFFHTTGITLEEIFIDGTCYAYQGFAYLHIRGIYDEVGKRSYYMKLQRNLANKYGCKVNELPYVLKIYNDYVDIIPIR